MQPFAQPHPFQQRLGAAFALSASGAGQQQRHRHVFQGGELGRRSRNPWNTKPISSPRTQGKLQGPRGRYVPAVEGYLSGGGGVQAAQQMHHGAFSGAAGPHNGRILSRGDVVRDTWLSAAHDLCPHGIQFADVFVTLYRSSGGMPLPSAF